MFTSIINAIADWFTVMETGMSINDTFYGIEGIYQMTYVINTYEKWHNFVPFMLVCIVAIIVAMIYVVYSIATAEENDKETEELTVA